MAVIEDSQTIKAREKLPAEPSDKSRVSPPDKVQAMIADAVHQALSDAGRAASDLERKGEEAARVLKEAQKERAEAEKMRREQEQQELERFSGDPEGLEVVKARQRQRVRDEEFRRKQEDLDLRDSLLKEKESKYKDSELKASVEGIVTKYPGVVAEDLLTFTDGTPEKMEALAKRLSAIRPVKPPLRIGSGLSSGGSSLDIKELRKQFIANPYDPETREAIDKYDREQQLKNRY